ncbi:MAG: M81 family metallopeptidase [Thermomicrobiaceae bacterium]
MQFGFARIFQKSNSFSIMPTNIETFRAYEWRVDDETHTTSTEIETVESGVAARAESQGFAVSHLLSTSAPSGGPVSNECVAEIARCLQERMTSLELDGLILEMSGAWLTEQAQSADEILVEQLARSNPGLRIVVALSSQANITGDLIALASGIVAPESIPNDNARLLGARAVNLLVRVYQCADQAELAFEQLPLLIPVASQASDREPMIEILARAAEMEQAEDFLSIAVLCGYPWADATHAGASVVVTAPAGSNRARAVASELSAMIWERRDAFYVTGSNIEEAVHSAMASKNGPVLITDLGDNPDDGAPGDGTTVLWALLDLGVRNATIGTIADEQAVEACIRAGADSKVEIPVGGRRDTRHGYPIDITARVVSVHDGQFTLNGPVGAGISIDAGRVVVLDVEARHEGHVELILTERPVQITDTSLFEHVGIDICERTIVSMKSVVDYRPAFSPLATEIFEVITPGITTPDPAFFAYERVRRPIFPLDPLE